MSEDVLTPIERLAYFKANAKVYRLDDASINRQLERIQEKYAINIEDWAFLAAARTKQASIETARQLKKGGYNQNKADSKPSSDNERMQAIVDEQKRAVLQEKEEEDDEVIKEWT